MLKLFGYKLGWRKVRVGCWAFTLVIGIVLVLPVIFQGFTREAWQQTLSYLGPTLPLLAMGIGGIFLIPIYQRQITRFRAALDPSGGNVPLVTNQPMPDSTALTLPTTVSLCVRWPAAVMWAAVLPVTFTVVLFGEVTLSGLSRAIGLAPFIWATGLALAFLIPLGMIYMPLSLRRTIRITEEGLSHQYSNYSRYIDSVAWDDMRIFALIAGGKRPGSSATYILNSGRRNVRWTHRARTRWYSITAPTTSDEEYQRQMEALLSYAAARTKLPLFDLR